MALPATIVSAATDSLPDQNYYAGPFKASTGRIYVVLVNSSPNGPRFYHADDPESTWTALGGGFLSTSIAQWTYQDGDILHTVHAGTTEIQYHRHNMATGVNEVGSEQIEAPKDPPSSTNEACAIATRGAGDPIVVLYAGDKDKNMGVDYDRVDYATRNASGTWSTPTQAFGATADENHYTGACIIPGTNNGLHLFARALIGSPRIYGRTLSSSNSLSTTVQNGETSIHQLMMNGVSFDDAGTQRVRIGYINTVTVELHIWRMDESSGSIVDVDEVTVSTANDVDIQNKTPVASLGVNGTTVHAVWSHDTDLDLYHDQAATPQATGDWGTDVEHRDAVTINRISCNIYNRDGVRYLAMVYDDGGTIKYDEIDIDVVPTNLSDVKFPQQSSYIGPFEI